MRSRSPERALHLPKATQRPARGRAGPQGPGSQPPPSPPPETENWRSLPSLTPRHPAPTHIPRSHPGCQPSCSTAQTSGHSARGIPMPGAPARPACCLLYCLQKCRRKGKCPGSGRRATPQAPAPSSSSSTWAGSWWEGEKCSAQR